MNGFTCSIVQKDPQKSYFLHSQKTDILKGQNIIVIGGGFAGMSAALEASMMGAHVILLEARDRLGGRVHTHQASPQVTLNLGANYVHDPVFNPVDELVQKHNIQPGKNGGFAEYFYGSSQKPRYGIPMEDKNPNKNEYYNTLPAIKHTNHIMEKAEEFVESALFWGLDQSKDYTVQQLLDGYLQENDITLSWEEKSFLNAIPTGSSGLNADELSMLDEERDINLYSYLKVYNSHLDQNYGGRDYALSDYGKIVAIYKKALEDHNVNIKLGRYVHQVDYDNKDDILVKLSDGTVYHGDYVISTLPIKLLANQKELFSPELPENIQKMATDIQMARWEKIAITFKNDMLTLDQSNLLSNIGGQYGHHYHPQTLDKDDIKIQMTKTHYDDSHVTFFCIVTADETKKMAKIRKEKGEEALKDQLLKSFSYLLEQHRGDDNTPLPTPEHIEATNWVSSPLSQGAWSAQSQKGFTNRQPHMYTLNKKGIGLAGEAFHPTHPGTTHGAILSGINAVLQQVDHISSQHNSATLWGHNRLYKSTPQEGYLSERHGVRYFTLKNDITLGTENIGWFPQIHQSVFKKHYNVTARLEKGRYRLYYDNQQNTLSMYNKDDKLAIKLRYFDSTDTTDNYADDVENKWALPVQYNQEAGLKIFPILQFDRIGKGKKDQPSNNFKVSLSMEVLPMRSVDYLAAPTK